MKRATSVLIGIIALLFIGGCTSQLMFPGYGNWDSKVATLGPVTFCSGGDCHNSDEGSQWPLSMKTPPNETTYHVALRKKAAKKYNVPEDEIVLSEVSVSVYAELDGTVRGWNATATAGRVNRTIQAQ